jgi:ATP-dependent Clp protease ATP-binding subunit ClpA
MLHEQEGPAARAIAALGVSPEAARAAIGAAPLHRHADEATLGRVPFDSRMPKVLEATLREALALGHNYIGTEHILLGLLEEEESLGGGTLAALGITKERHWPGLSPCSKADGGGQGPMTLCLPPRRRSGRPAGGGGRPDR